MEHWLRLRASNSEGLGLIPDCGARDHMPQLRPNAAKYGEALYSQQKQDQELTVAEIMTLYCQIQTSIEESR